MNYATANGTATAGSDYMAKSGTLSWADGDATDKYFDVPITDDSIYEGNETFTAALSGASGASLGSPSSTTATITDNERGSLQFTASTYAVDESDGSIRIYVSRTGGSYGAASVNYATANGTATAGSDYTAKSGTLSWEDGDAGDKYFDVPITDDSIYEGDETFTATLSGASGASLGNPSTTTVTITDNEMTVTIAINHPWMYQNLVGQTGCAIAGTAAVMNDPAGNTSYNYEWAVVPPGDVTAPPTLQPAGASCTVIAGNVSSPGSVSNSGGSFILRVTVTGNQYGNTGTAQVPFGVCLLGDVNNDTVVNAADRSIVNAVWQTGAAGSFTLYDCDVNGDGVVNAADRSIANAVWRGTLGQNSVGAPCPNR